MPQSFLTSEGFQSPVMPGVQLANPGYFGGVGPQFGAGIQGATNVAGELQRQQQLALMAPIQRQVQQEQLARLQAMTPLEVQQAKINMARAMMPTPIEEGLVNSTTEFRPGHMVPLADEDEAALKKIEAEQGPEAAQEARRQMQSMSTTAMEPVQMKQVGLYAPNMQTGAMERVGERQIPTETEAQWSSGEAQKAVRESQAQAAEARVEVERLRALMGGAQGQKAIPVKFADGTTHLMQRQFNPTTGTIQNIDMGEAGGREASGVTLDEARAKREEASAKNINELGERTREVTSRGQELVIQKRAAAFDLDVDTYKALRQTSQGRAILYKKTLGNTLSDAEEQYVESIAAAKPKAPQAETTPQAEAPSITVPPQNPDPVAYKALASGAPYYWDGVLHHKGQ